MQILESAPIEALCWRAGGAAGVTRRALLAEAGSYLRPLPRWIETSEMEPWASQYPPLGDASHQPTPQVVCYELTDARVTSEGCVITRDGHVVRETLGNLLSIEGLSLYGLRPLDPGGIRFEQVAQPTRRIAAPSLLLKRAWWRNFGHWMLESAATLALMRSNEALDATLHVVTGRFQDAAMRRAVLASLCSLWPWPDPVVEEHDDHEMVTFERLLFVTPVHDYNLQEPASVQALRRFLTPPDGPPGPRRIFIDRASRLRRLVNQDEVRAICAACGCVPVRPSDLPLLEQVRVFRDAELIVGTKGSDFVNAMFCTPGATLFVLCPGDFPDPMVWDVSAHAPLHYFELYGSVIERIDSNGRNPFRISCGKLRTGLALACDPSPGARTRFSMSQWRQRGYTPWLDRWA